MCLIVSNNKLLNAISLLSVQIVYCDNCEEKGPTLWNYHTSIICTGIVDKFPRFKPYLFSMYCINCNVSRINNETMQNFARTVFYMNHSHITSIENGAFSTFRSEVRKFLFNDNDIKYVEGGLFKKFIQLSELNFKKNKLRKLLPNQFVDVRTEVLDLSFNQIKQLDGFDGMTVGVLELSFNEIDVIPINVFAEVTFKSHVPFVFIHPGLHLQSNNISELYAGSFNYKGSMELLNLSDNKISVIKNDTFTIQI